MQNSITKNTISKALVSLFVVVTVVGPVVASANANPLSNVFPDVQQGNQYFTAVSCLSGTPYPITVGYGDGLFRPNQNISREEALAFITKYHIYSALSDWALTNPSTQRFPDVASSNMYYRYIDTAFARGYIADTITGQNFNPSGSWTYGFPGIYSVGGASGTITRGDFLLALYNYGMAHNQLPACVPTTPTNPTVDIKANGSNGPVTISSGETVSLSWVSSGATTCSASGAWGGAKGLNGSETSPTLTTTRTFSITCINSTGQSAFDSVTVNVTSQPNLPTVDLKANGSNGPVTITSGTQATLSWTTQDATECHASGGPWTGVKNYVGGYEATNVLYANATYTITCSNSAGSDSDSVTINVTSQQNDPTVDIKANGSNGPITIAYGASATLSWTSTDASACTATGSWSGSKNVNDSQSTNALFTNKTYIITCTNSVGASASDSVTVNVEGQQVNDPTVDIKANGSNGPITIAYNTQATLSWTVTNANSCSGSGAWSGTKNYVGGSESSNPLTQTRTFTITCTNSVGASASDSVTVNVSPQQQQDPTVDLTASPTNVNYNNRTTLSWTSQNADYCYASGGAWSGNNKPINSSEQSNNLTQNTTFSITCVNSQSGVSASDTAYVTVSGQQQGQTPSVDLYAAPSTVPYGTQSILYWNTQNTTECHASGGPWTGVKNYVGGYESTNVLYGATTYTITCSNATGVQVTDTATVFVTGQNNGYNYPPTLNLYASPSTVQSGGNSTLYWNTTNADSCTASGDWYGSKAVNGSEMVYGITTNRNYILTCYGPGGSIVRNTTVSPIGQVYGAVAPTLTIYAIPTPVNYGSASTVYWNAQNVDNCTASGAWYGPKTITGQYATGPLFADSNYTITCYGLGGTITRTATVPVIKPTYTPVVLGDTYVPPAGVYSASIEKTMENLATGNSGTAVSARPGNEIRYTITVRNTGNRTLTNLVVRDPLTDKVDVKTISDNGTYNYVNRTVTWKIGSLAPDASKSVTLLVRVVMCDTDTTIENKAYVDNSQISEVTSNGTVAGVTTGPLVVTIDNSDQSVNAGDTVNYTVRYSNGTNSTLRGATMSVYIPSGMTIAGYSNTCTLEGNTLKLSIGDIAPGKSGQIQVSGKIDSGVLPGEILTTRAVVSYTDSSGISRESSATTISKVSGGDAFAAAVSEGTNRSLRFLPDTFFGWLLLLLLIIVLAIFIKRLLSKDENEKAGH